MPPDRLRPAVERTGAAMQRSVRCWVAAVVATLIVSLVLTLVGAVDQMAGR